MDIKTARRKRNKLFNKAEFQKEVREAFKEIKERIARSPEDYGDTYGEGELSSVVTIAKWYGYTDALKAMQWRFSEETKFDDLEAMEGTMSEVLNEWIPKGVEGSIQFHQFDNGDYDVVLYVDDEWVEEYAKNLLRKRG